MRNTVTGASVRIIALTDNIIVDKWHLFSIKIQPQVWLAIFSTISNALLGSAVVEGLTIYFWKRAGRGMSVSQGYFRFISFANLLTLTSKVARIA